MNLLGRMITEPDKRLLFKFAYNFGYKGMRAVNKFKSRLKKGINFPAFLFISVTNNCNLTCQGCWSTASNPPKDMDHDCLRKIINESRQQGSYFFGILGGEPLLHKGLLELLAEFPDCYFILFTNGTLITNEVANKIRKIGNISPLISIEGTEDVSDERRGDSNVLNRTMDGLRTCKSNKLITGVATSVCKSNIKELATDEFIQKVADEGALYLWYYIYRPVGPNPTPELTLSEDEITSLREFIVNSRAKSPLMIIDAYWDHDGNALCPAATGMGHHINPYGYVEPCPPVQFALDNISGDAGLFDTISNSNFLADFRKMATETTRGCILLDNPAKLKSFIEEHKAIDTTGRNKGPAELEAMTKLPSHHISSKAIPEKSFTYRFAKKYWFFGFGAYG